MSFNEQLPEWENEGTQPPQSKRVEGWLPTEKPPASWFNWLFGRTYRVLKELQEKAALNTDLNALDQRQTNHENNKNNPHGVTKDQVGLGNVDNVQQATKVEHNQLSQTVNAHLAETVQDGVHGMGSIASEEYEEGTWTPSLQFGGDSSGMSYALQSGRYTRVGRIIHIQGAINLSAKGTSIGSATIIGLPFTSPSLAPVISVPLYALRVTSTENAVGGVFGTLNAGTSSLILANATPSTGPALNNENFTDNSILRFEFTYTI